MSYERLECEIASDTNMARIKAKHLGKERPTPSAVVEAQSKGRGELIGYARDPLMTQSVGSPGLPLLLS